MFEGETAKGALLLSVVEGVGEDKKQQLEKEFGKLDFLPFKDYPHEEYLRLIEKAAEILSPSNKAEGYRMVGKNVYLVVKDTLIVKTLRITMRLNDFESMLERGVPEGYKRFTTYSTSSVEKTGEKEYLVTIRDTSFYKDPAIAEYHRGVIEGIAEGEGSEVETAILKVEGDTAKIKVRIKKV